MSGWLGDLERQLAGAGVGRGRSTLNQQLGEVQGVERELGRGGHHVTLLGQMCAKLVSLYAQEECSGVARLGEELGGRFQGLVSSLQA